MLISELSRFTQPIIDLPAFPGGPISYHPPEAVLKLLLADANATQGWQYRYRSSPSISHPCEADGWAEYERDDWIRAQIEAGSKLVLLWMYVDGFLFNNTTRTEVRIFFLFHHLPQ